jgi:hypothetical protein
MAFPPIFAEVRKAPGMFLPATTYEAAASFVQGYDTATDGGLLLGFREWLIPRLDGGNNLGWPRLVLEIMQLKKPAAEDPQAAIEHLFNTIEAFLDERGQRGGARRIFATYERWLQKQDWYDSSSPHWIPPNP